MRTVFDQVLPRMTVETVLGVATECASKIGSLGDVVEYVAATLLHVLVAEGFETAYIVGMQFEMRTVCGEIQEFEDGEGVAAADACCCFGESGGARGGLVGF
jgi:hypothetical protein